MNVKFAAFIMTYERPVAVGIMIRKLMQQTRPPQKILVVDNSHSFDTEALVHSFGNGDIDYHRVGFNSGPAGAAHIGLTRLTEEGYQWIYWGDDDDPPEDIDDFEVLFDVVRRAGKRYEKIGIVGKGAGSFNPWTGRTRSFLNRELEDEIMEGGFVPGNSVLIVNSEVVKSGVLPTQQLFFGFEELDFCLQVKREGFRVVFDAGAFLKKRIAAGKGGDDYRWRGTSSRETNTLWRQYYSTRNILNVLYRNRLWTALVINMGRAIVKSIYGFKYGSYFGIRNFKIQILALVHFFSGKYGKVDLEHILK